ncbi:MAG: exosortase U [Planctomycetaceae bacterium]|nr:exosortase U [Planctomycetaceae bacterium]
MTPEPSPPTELPESPSAQTSRRKHHLGLILLCLGASLILTRYLTRKPTQLKIPGPARGDLVLVAGDLPESLGAWKQIRFEPAGEPTQLPDGQFWWSHVWQYSDGNLGGSVAFDQAGFEHWHDLTICYEALGWTVVQRRIVRPENDTTNWPCVLVSFHRNHTEFATLVFSLFFDDGDPVDAAAYVEASSLTTTFEKTVTSRIDARRPRSSRVSSARQCQVFVSHSESLKPETEMNVIDLHLRSREIFRSRWLNRALKSNGDSLANLRIGADRQRYEELISAGTQCL